METEITGKEKYEQVYVPELNLNIFYVAGVKIEHARRLYDVILEKKDEGELQQVKDISIEELMHHHLAFGYIGSDKSDTAQKLFSAIDGDMMLNPLYRKALSSGDECFAAGIRFCYHKDTADDCELFSRIFKTRILPRLSGEYDRSYIVEKEGADMNLLWNSGYDIGHFPNFSMCGCTRHKIQLNPCRKVGSDAAGEKDKAIPFSEYLKLFE